MKKTTSILVGTIVLILLIVFIMFRNKEQSAVENIKVPENNLLVAAGVWQIDKKERCRRCSRRFVLQGWCG